jgi:ferritin-like metal-binding protein YciE
MASPETLKDLYIEELRDLWSANDQMQKILPKLSAEAGSKLKKMLDLAVGGIQQHTEILKSLVESNEGKMSKDHCRGMEGLVKEAEKHALDEEVEDSDVRDAVILGQYQRMCHYGLAGFGTAAAYAKALGLTDDEQKLEKAVSEIYSGDQAASHLAETAVNLAAKHAKAA